METNLRYRVTLKKRKYVQVLREAIAEKNREDKRWECSISHWNHFARKVFGDFVTFSE